MYIYVISMFMQLNLGFLITDSMYILCFIYGIKKCINLDENILSFLLYSCKFLINNLIFNFFSYFTRVVQELCGRMLNLRDMEFKLNIYVFCTYATNVMQKYA